MKFLCEQCKAKYQISDEKVAGKTVRMKCRKCGHMIEVRAEVTETSVSKGLPGGAAPTAQHKSGQPKPGGLATSLSAAGRPSPPRAAVPSTRPETQPSALAGAFQKSKSEESALDAFGSNEWYVAINGVPVGPVRVSELRRKAAMGVVTEDSLVWQEGLEEWRPVRAVTELAGLVREAAARPSLVTPPPSDVRQSTPPPGAPASARAGSGAPRPSNAGIAPRAFSATAPQPFSPTSAGEVPRPPVAPSARNNVVPFASSRLATAEKLDAPDAQHRAAPHPASLVAADPFALPPAPAAAMQSGVTSSPLGVANAFAGSAPAPAVAPAEPPPAAAKGPPNWIAITMVVLAASLGITAPIAYFFKPAPVAPTPVVITMSAAPQGPPPPVAATPPSAEPASVPSAAPDKQPGAVVRNTGGPKPAAPPQGGAKIDLGGLLGGPGSGPNGGPGGGAAGSSGSSLTGSAIESVVRSHAAGVKRTCWERGANQEASENVTVRVVIGSSGAVQSASSSGGSDPAMSKCIENSVRSWQFPPSGGTTNVDIPFHFVRQ